MMASLLPGLLKIALDAVDLASKEILQIYLTGMFDAKYKDDQSPITLADLRSNEVLIETLGKSNIPIVSEEALVPYGERRKWSVFCDKDDTSFRCKHRFFIKWTR